MTNFLIEGILFPNGYSNLHRNCGMLNNFREYLYTDKLTRSQHVELFIAYIATEFYEGVNGKEFIGYINNLDFDSLVVEMEKFDSLTKKKFKYYISQALNSTVRIHHHMSDELLNVIEKIVLCLKRIN